MSVFNLFDWEHCACTPNKSLQFKCKVELVAVDKRESMNDHHGFEFVIGCDVSKSRKLPKAVRTRFDSLIYK